MTQGPEPWKKFFWTGHGPGGRGQKAKFLCILYKNCILLEFKKDSGSEGAHGLPVCTLDVLQ
jgi:hypothetical protein